MYLVQKNRIRWKNQREYKLILRLARLSKNVYNTALYHVSNHFDLHQKYLQYTDLYKIMKGQDENYIQLPSQTAQQTLKMLDRAMRSYFSLIKLKKQCKYDEKVDLPHYKSKLGYFTCIFPKQQFK